MSKNIWSYTKTFWMTNYKALVNIKFFQLRKDNVKIKSYFILNSFLDNLLEDENYFVEDQYECQSKNN